jgi:3D (Asp-Asp-Asp) domain-containing protein
MDQEEQAGILDQSHSSKGYNLGFYGSHAAYHFLIGKDGTVKQNRSLDERTGHTRSQLINLSSIAVALAGDFNRENPTEAQLIALRGLVARLDGIYHFDAIVGHRNVSPTACPGNNLYNLLMKEPYFKLSKSETYGISRYYTPVPNQAKYYRETYDQDFVVNCQGDCFKTADGTDLHNEEPFSTAACPPNLPFGTRLWISMYGLVTCHDRGGAIKDKRIDLWAGSGDNGLRNIRETIGGKLTVWFIDK